MDKETFYLILETTLLYFDEVTEQQLIQEYKIEPKLVRAEIKLYKYLKGLKVS